MVVGVDEAGRGPLAGPLVAAACYLPVDTQIEGIDDSKKLTPARRTKLYQELVANEGVKFGVSVVSVEVIDELNIYQATLFAMKEAIEKMPLDVDSALIDGMPLTIEGIETVKIIKGDQLSLSIGAASIIAKETRDKIMIEQLDPLYPEYGFKKHKGYGTKAHLEALHQHGPTAVHRKSFSPVKEMVLVGGSV